MPNFRIVSDKPDPVATPSILTLVFIALLFIPSKSVIFPSRDRVKSSTAQRVARGELFIICIFALREAKIVAVRKILDMASSDAKKTSQGQRMRTYGVLP